MADPSETTQISRAPTDADERERELLAAVRSLSAQVGSLQTEVHALRSHAASLPQGETDGHGWDEPPPQAVREAGAWVRSLDAPSSRRPSVPVLAIEIAFLVAVAVLATVADFDPPVIAAVMLVAWVVVALAEWAGARAARRRNALAYGTFAPSAIPSSLPEDPSWLEPPAERTALDVSRDAESTVTRLPQPSDE